MTVNERKTAILILRLKKFRSERVLYLSVYILIFLMLLCDWSNGQRVVVVKNHVAKASIVISPKADSQIIKAAFFLQNVVKKSTGAVLPITTIPTKKMVSINIGKTDFVISQNIDLRSLDEDGFLLTKADSQNFVILGGTDWGTEYGVYAFLEKFGDVVDLMPGDIGFDIPSHASLKVPDIRIVDNPVYLSRQLSPIDITVDYPLGKWGRFNRQRNRIFFHHNLWNLFDPKEYFKTNPDFYPLVNNRSEMPKGTEWQPNFSAPGIADSASKKIIRYFRQNPSISSYSLGMNDFSIFDQSANSRLRRIGGKNYLGYEDVSNDYFEWANDVVEKVTRFFPDKKFGLLAYENISTPPSKNVGIDPHIVPFLTYERMRWSDSTLKKQGHLLTKNWASLANSLGWYDYTYGLDYLAPRVWFHEMQDYLIWGSKNKVKYYYAELYPNWGEGPKAWVQNKLLWNPYLNVDSLLNIWYTRMAGNKAALKLKEFYSIWEKFWTYDILFSKWYTDKGQYLNFDDFSYLEAVPDEYILRADKLMKSAYQLADNVLRKQRVNELLKMWKLYKLAIELYQQSNLPQNKRQQAISSSSEFIKLMNSLEKDPLHAASVARIKLDLGMK